MLVSDETPTTIKLIVVGPSGAGKSALVRRYCHNKFDSDAGATIGIDFERKHLAVYGKRYRLTIFDTAGQERYRSLSTSFYRGTHAVIFVYDICSRASFLDFHRWMAEAEQLTVPNTIFYIVGSKLDKAETGRAVTAEEGAALAKKRGAGFCELSSQTGEDVRELFLEVVKLVVQSPELMAAVAAGKTPGTIAMSVGQPEGSSGCWC